jgi:hypothetical protein
MIKEIFAMNEYEKILNKNIRERLPNAEVISDFLDDAKDHFQNADYFFENRQIVGELKCLEGEMHPKVQAYIDKMLEDGKIHFSGKLRIDYVLKNHPRKEEINREINKLVTSSLEDCVEKANRQIRETREYFSLPNARGFLFIVNNANFVLEPKNAFWNLHRMLNKKKPDGSIRHESINYIVYTSDNHYFQEGKMTYLPFFKLINNRIAGYCKEDEAFLDRFGAWFSRIKGMRYIEANHIKGSDVMNLPFKTKEK